MKPLETTERAIKRLRVAVLRLFWPAIKALRRQVDGLARKLSE